MSSQPGQQILPTILDGSTSVENNLLSATPKIKVLIRLMLKTGAN